MVHLIFALKYSCSAFQSRLTASAIGNIVGMQSEQIQQIASEYSDKVRSYKILPRLT